MIHPILAHRLTNDVKLLHKVALVSQNCALILKRAPTAQSRPNCWDLPGGNSEWPANQDQIQQNLHQLDIQREILEETGVTVWAQLFTPANLVYFATFFEPDQSVYSINCGWLVNLDQVAITFEKLLKKNPQESGDSSILEHADQKTAAPSFPAITLSSEHTQYAWITLDQLVEYDFGGPARDYETAIIRFALKDQVK